MDDRADTGTADALRRAVVGQFLLREEVGRGGMGVVFRAYDEQLQRDVAIKTLPPHLALDPQVRSRFLREARTAASLSHPNIVPIYSAAERDGVVFFAMGLVTGQSLAQQISERGTLSARELVPILQQLASALGYAHSRGVVHRDVKAENVLMDAVTGRAMVTDFGIARVTEAQPLTATGTVLGTVHYMSPEQVSGDTLDGRSDLYSLGVLAFMALSGRFPFERPSASAVVVAHVVAMPPRLSDVLPSASPEMEALIARLLAKSPDDRFPDAAALRAALDDPRLLREATPAPRELTNLTSTEAQEIWSRAATLQANTSGVTPPVPFVPRGDIASATEGFQAAVVKQSAIEAGIDAVFVERALAEKASVERVAKTEVHPGERMQERPNWYLGARTKLEYAAVVDGELDGDGFEEIADAVRQALGGMVTVSSVGRTLTVSKLRSGGGSNQQMQSLEVTLTSRKGRTQVRAYEDLSGPAVGLFVGLGVGAATGISSMAAALIAKGMDNVPLGLMCGAASFAAFQLVARLGFRRTVREHDASLQAIVRRVVERTRAVIANEPRDDHALAAPSGERLLP